MIKVFNNDIADLKAFGQNIEKVYAYGETVWEKNPQILDYLCFTALESGTFTLTIPAAVTTTNLSYIEYSLDGRNWSRTPNEDSVEKTIQVGTQQNPIPVGGKVYWRGSGNQMGRNTSTYSTFSATGNFDVSGNIHSLLFGDNFASATAYGGDYALAGLFYGNEKLIHAHNLVFPTFANKLAAYCYLFANCSNLVSIADLPALTISGNTYFGFALNCTSLASLPTISATTMTRPNACYRMFKGCTSLTGQVSINIQLQPDANANCSQGFLEMFYGCSGITSAVITTTGYDTALFEGCFRGCSSMTTLTYTPPTTAAPRMFLQFCAYCTALTTIPDFNIATLPENCFNSAFYGCSNLAYVKCLATDISANNCTLNWLQNVSSTGTFIKAEGVTWPSGASGIPSTWVQIEKRTMPAGYKQVEWVANPNKPSSGIPPVILSGIILDPSQDTIEIATKPTLDENGYVAHYMYGGMLMGNTTNPAASGSKPSLFFFLFRKYSTVDVIQFSFTKADTTSSNLQINNKLSQIAGTPLSARVELSSGNNKIYFNGTQVASNTDTCDVSDMGTAEVRIFGYNNANNSAARDYNWIDPIYFYKHWRALLQIADYVPCIRLSDGEVSFYDFSANEFKVPSRLGFFVAGPDV